MAHVIVSLCVSVCFSILLVAEHNPNLGKNQPLLEKKSYWPGGLNWRSQMQVWVFFQARRESVFFFFSFARFKVVLESVRLASVG